MKFYVHLLDIQVLVKLLKFGLVGLTGMGVDFSITWLGKEKLHINKYIANSAGFSVAVLSNFLLNYYWTFSSKSNFTSSLAKFVLIAVAGLLINNLVIYFFNDRKYLNFYVSKALAIVVVFFWNFGLNYLFNFHS